VFSHQGKDPKDPTIKLIGLNPEWRGVKLADRVVEEVAPAKAASA
jgi:hypothetical protein